MCLFMNEIVRVCATVWERKRESVYKSVCVMIVFVSFNCDVSFINSSKHSFFSLLAKRSASNLASIFCLDKKKIHFFR